MGNIILLNNIYPYELPPEPQMEKDILFAGLPVKDQYWRRTEQPRNWKDLAPKAKASFIETEVDRMFISGVWFANNGNLVYLPPDAYSYFNWWRMKDGHYPKFRYAQYREFLFERFCEAIPNCIGSVRFKKRRDGLTTRRMARKVWKAIQPENANTWCGMQSKTGKDASDVCWKTLMTGYNALPHWVKPIQSGSSDPKKKLEFKTPATRLSRSNMRSVQEEMEQDTSLDNTIDFRDTTEDAYDGQELLDMTVDESAKWKKARVLKALITYVRCVWKDHVKVGHIHMISSPSEENGRAHDESVTLWKMADPHRSLKFSEDGRSFEVIKRSWFMLHYFTSALEGYGSACDIYGNCDQALAADLIKEEIANTPKEEQASATRQLPLSIQQILTNTTNSVFGCSEEMDERKIYLLGTTYKDEVTKEPKYIYGNLEWKNALIDTEVEFRPAKDQSDFSLAGRFCFQHLPPEEHRNGLIRKRKLDRMVMALPPDAPNVIGIDPYDYRRTLSNNISQGAALGGCALDFYDQGVKDKMWFAYLFRPKRPDDFYEDMLKAAMFCTAWMQVEAKNKNILDYGENRGYFDCFLPKDIKHPLSEHKGNPTTVNLTDEMLSLIDSYYGNGFTLEDFWFDFVLSDNLAMNPEDSTTQRHLTMAQGQLMLGIMKRRLSARTKIRKPDGGVNQQIAATLYSQYFKNV